MQGRVHEAHFLPDSPATTLLLPKGPTMKSTTPTQLCDPFVTAPKAREFLGGVDPSTLDDWISRGILPPPIRITQRTIGWRMSSLVAVLDRAAADGPAA